MTELEPSAESGPAAPFLGVASVIEGRPISIAVLDLATLEIRLRLDLPDWTDFRPASAGHRLIERGFMTLPAAHFEPDTMAGWRAAGNGAYVAPLIPNPYAAAD